jgi:hypothetical protein
MRSELPEPGVPDPPGPVQPPRADINKPPTNWRSITANIIIVTIAVLTALPETWGATGNPPIWLSSTQVVAIVAILQGLLRIPVIANWLHDNRTVDETERPTKP